MIRPRRSRSVSVLVTVQTAPTAAGGRAAGAYPPHPRSSAAHPSARTPLLFCSKVFRLFISLFGWALRRAGRQ